MGKRRGVRFKGEEKGEGFGWEKGRGGGLRLGKRGEV